MNIVGMNSPDQPKDHGQVQLPVLLPNIHLLAGMGPGSTGFNALAELSLHGEVLWRYDLRIKQIRGIQKIID